MMNGTRDHGERILRVLVHMQQHLDEALSPLELAEVACYSPHHFHRTFKGMVGETVMGHVRRLRLERAAWRLRDSGLPVTRIAFEAGYETHESFTRAFHAAFGCAPSEFRAERRRQGTLEAPTGVHFRPGDFKPVFVPASSKGDQIMEIKTFPQRRVAFVRHIGPYHEVGAAWSRITMWAAEEGLIGSNEQMFGLCYDDPEITPPEKIRYDACVVVGPEIEPRGDIGVQEVPGGEYAVMRHRGPFERLGETYAELFGVAIPAAGRSVAALPSLEIYWTDPESTPPEELDTDVCVLLEPQR
jgi:AraC family transcriptional regulator